MPSGIFGATITNLVAGTTIVAADVLASMNSLKVNGLNNDGALIQTDGSGNVITPAGRLRNVSFITPYHLYTNPTVTAGNTRTDTVTGGATGVPTGAIAVILCVNVYSVTAGGTCQIYPAGGTPGQYNNFTPQWTANNQYTGMGMTVVPVSGSGQITVKAASQNMVLSDWYIYGYII